MLADAIAWIRALHIAAGVVALATFIVPLLVAKGAWTHRRVGWVYVVAMIVALIATGCPVFGSDVPCTTDDDCVRAERCDEHGFCAALGVDDDAGVPGDGGAREDAGSVADAGPVVDAGARADGGTVVDAGPGADAGGAGDGGVPVDAGFPDAGFADAGFLPTDGGSLLLTLTGRSSSGAGTAIPLEFDERLLPGSASFWRVTDAVGAAVPFVFDPFSAAVPPDVRIWIVLDDPLQTNQTRQYRIRATQVGGGPAPSLEDVFTIGDAFDAPGQSGLTTTGGGDDGTATIANGRLVLSAPDNDDAAIGRTTTSLLRTQDFEAHLRVRIPNIDVTNGELRLLAFTQGVVPNPTDDLIGFGDAELGGVGIDDGGLFIWLEQSAGSTIYWDGAAWDTDPFARIAVTTGMDTNVLIANTGTAVAFGVGVTGNDFDVTVTDLVPWSSVPNDATPLWIYWGDPAQGPGWALHHGALDCDAFALRRFISAGPTGTIVAQ